MVYFCQSLIESNAYLIIHSYIKKEFGNPRLMLRLGWSNHGEQHDSDRVTYFQKHLPVVLDAIYKDKVNLFCLIGTDASPFGWEYSI